jgi:uncharacterized protein YaeQ
MALTATLHRFEVTLSDTDRGVYESLDLRVARHPSETMRYMLTRLIAYCLAWEQDIAFSRGLSTTDEPAVWVRHPDGRVRLWLDVGSPSPERLHKASKLAERVAVYTYGDVPAMQRAARAERVHRAEHIEVVAVPEALLDALGAVTERTTHFELVHTGGQLYVTVSGRTYEGALERSTLGDPSARDS